MAISSAARATTNVITAKVIEVRKVSIPNVVRRQVLSTCHRDQGSSEAKRKKLGLELTRSAASRTVKNTCRATACDTVTRRQTQPLIWDTRRRQYWPLLSANHIRA